MMVHDIHDLCTYIRDMKPNPDETEAILAALSANLGFADEKTQSAILDAYEAVGSFIGHQDALAYEEQAERDAKGPI